MGPPGMPASKNKQDDMALDHFSYIMESFCTGPVSTNCVSGIESFPEAHSTDGRGKKQRSLVFNYKRAFEPSVFQRGHRWSFKGFA